MSNDPRLDERDLEILQILWKQGPLKPSELQDRLTFTIKNSALRWLLNDLVERGQLHRSKSGKAFTYRAAVERQSYLAALGSRLKVLLFGGSAMAMIGELVQTQNLSKEEIEYLKEVVRERKSTPQKKKNPKSQGT